MDLPRLTTSYTIEEAAIIAELHDLEALPGCAPLPLGASLRSLATRSLLAHHVLVPVADGGLELEQPHATVFATILDADDVVQHLKHRPEGSAVEHWFVTDACTVHLATADGIVTTRLFAGRAGPEVGDPLDVLAAGSPVNGFDEIVRVVRGADTLSAERTLVQPAAV